jgi:hypothetical protein
VLAQLKKKKKKKNTYIFLKKKNIYQFPFPHFGLQKGKVILAILSPFLFGKWGKE